MGFPFRKTTHQILLLLLIPLLVETGLLFVIFDSFNKLEAESAREGQSLDALLRLNMTLNDMVSAAASLMMFSVWQEPGFLMEFNEKHAVLKKNAQALKKSLGSGSIEVANLANIMDDAISTFESVEEMAQDSFEKDNVATIERLKSFLRRMDSAGHGALEQQLSTRKRLQERENSHRQHLIQLIQLGVAINLMLTAFAAAVFVVGFARRFQIVVADTQKVASGMILQSHLPGKDELANLDQLIYKLSYELDAARKMERAMIDNTAEIICSLDETYRLREINKAVQKRLGYKPDELIGTNVQSLIHPDDKDETYRELEFCKNTVEEVSIETRLRRADGKYTHYECTTKWSPENRSMSCVMHDVTERKEAEKLKQEVLAMVSHDLRAPLTSLGMTLDMVTEGVVGNLDPRGEKLINRAKYSVSSLITMINDLIDVERFEAGGIKLNYEETPATDLTAQALELVIQEAERKKISLTADVENFRLRVDKERLSRVVMNLVNNAIKFTPEGRSILVTARLLRSKSGRPFAEFQIVDQGPGIAEDKLDLVFEKFKQAGTGSEGERVGSGLGLAICKAIVEAHNGNIGVNSRLGEGSSFWFRVPQAPSN
jgi:PAS domain S-box-containing protein